MSDQSRSDTTPGDLARALRRSVATASNDDYTKPGTVERMRHADRLDAMTAAAEFLEGLADHG